MLSSGHKRAALLATAAASTVSITGVRPRHLGNHAREGIMLVIGAVPPTQDRRRLTHYMRLWLVERFFAWMQWQRRILVRWEYHNQNFPGFVQLACLVILFRRF